MFHYSPSSLFIYLFQMQEYILCKLPYWKHVWLVQVHCTKRSHTVLSTYKNLRQSTDRKPQSHNKIIIIITIKTFFNTFRNISTKHCKRFVHKPFKWLAIMVLYCFDKVASHVSISSSFSRPIYSEKHNFKVMVNPLSQEPEICCVPLFHYNCENFSWPLVIKVRIVVLNTAAS